MKNFHSYTSEGYQQKKEFLKDITEIRINTELPVAERIRQFVYQLGNPYIFLVGDTVVETEYRGINDIEESLEKLFSSN